MKTKDTNNKQWELEAEKEGIKNQIYLSLAIAKKTFSSLYDINVTIEYDPEIHNQKKFDIHLTVVVALKQFLKMRKNSRKFCVARLIKRH